MKDELDVIEKEKQKARLGGGLGEVERQHGKGRLTARERLHKLLDPGRFQEIDLLASSSSNFLDPASAPTAGDGVIAGYGRISGSPVVVWSQDATVCGGSLGVVHATKITTAMQMALRARVPIIGIVDTEGERPSDSVTYPHFYSLESMCQSQVMSSGVIPQIMLVMGPCTEGMAISTALADFVFFVRKTSHMHVGPVPEGASGEDLGDSWLHAKKTGCCDVLAENDEDCLAKCRQLLSYLPLNNRVTAPLVDSGDDINRREEELLELVPANESKPFDMLRLISLVVDNGEIFEIKHYWAANLIVCFARLGGQVVGILANNPQYMGGCMNLDAADKMARFVRFCSAFSIPLIWLADCPAFLPSVDEEIRGIIRHGSKIIMANTLASVPQITVIVRKLYGGGGLAMPGARLGGDIFVAWPTLARGLMGPAGAVSILYRKELDAIKDKVEQEKQRQKLIAEINEKLTYQKKGSVMEFLDPRDTRPFLIQTLNLLKDKERNIEPRKHDNIRL